MFYDHNILINAVALCLVGPDSTEPTSAFSSLNQSEICDPTALVLAIREAKGALRVFCFPTKRA